MISERTLERIWKCNREIKVGTELLEEMKRIADNIAHDKNPERLRDAFGRERNLQLGIPCGESGHRLLDVSPVLAISIINTHIANKKAELIEANEQARLELNAA